MPILTIQRRLREAGRIRLGHKVVTRSGKTAPAKLESFRFTSRDRAAIEAAAELYGGVTQPWADAPDGTGEQWEVFTETNEIDVIIPPGDIALSQWFEFWGKGGCERRCDGVREMIADQPCVCDARGLTGRAACSPHTRVNVMLRDLAGLGVWRVESSGVNAAAELAGAVELCSRATAMGRLLPAKLRLEQRSSLGAPGEPAKHFAVPVLDVQVTPDRLGLVMGGASLDAIEAPGNGFGEGVRAIEAGVIDDDPEPPPVDGGDPPPPDDPEPRGLTRVPDTVPEAPAPSIAEQLGTAFTPKARRANAAAPIPATGLKPVGVADLGPGEHPDDEGGDVTAGGPAGGVGPPETVPTAGPGGEVAGEPSAHHNTTSSGSGEARAQEPTSPPGLVNDEGAQNVARWCREAGIGEDRRHRFLGAVSGGRYWSAHMVPVPELPDVKAILLGLHEGRCKLVLTDAEHAQVVTVDGDIITTSVSAFVEDAAPMPAGLFWKERVAAARGIGVAKFIRQARSVAERLKVDLPSGLDSMPEHAGLRRELLAWLADQSPAEAEADAS